MAFDLDDEELKATKRMNGTSKDEEEDIKILESIVKVHNRFLKGCKKETITEREIQALENLLTKYKNLVEIEAEHQRINGELREKVKKLEETDLTSVYLKGVYDGQDKWKNKIKEKIEELIKEADYRTEDNPKGRIHFKKEPCDYQIEVLQDLLKEDQ